MTTDDYITDLRHGFATSMGTAQYMPGRVVGTGTLKFNDPTALERLQDAFRLLMDNPKLAAPMTVDELEASYRV